MINLALRDAVRKLIPSSLKEFLASLFTSELIGSILKAKGWVNSRGCMFCVSHPRISNREAASIFWGFRERAEIDLVKHLLPINKESTVVELGGSIGVVASYVAKLKPKRMVVVEADPEILGICEMNVNRNSSEDIDVVFLNNAITYVDDPITRFLPGSTTTSGKIDRSPESGAGITVSSVSLSKILLSESIVEYILISDIEGAEADIWFRDQRALKDCSAIVVELEDTEQYSTQDQIEQLQTLGFNQSYQYGRVYFFEKAENK
jgi:FkbM family methyltransferase